MATSARFVSADLELLPEDGKRYEIIDGELFVTRQPGWHHQGASDHIAAMLEAWSLETGAGTARTTPGVIFADDDDVAPDVVWVSARRLREILGDDGHLHGPPELIIEVLSPGVGNERRDRGAKLKLYSRRGVDEYWLVDWQHRSVAVYRRQGESLQLAETLQGEAAITSPLLPGFAGPLAQVFAGLP